MFFYVQFSQKLLFFAHLLFFLTKVGLNINALLMRDEH